jgi:hypothetical protein
VSFDNQVALEKALTTLASHAPSLSASASDHLCPGTSLLLGMKTRKISDAFGADQTATRQNARTFFGSCLLVRPCSIEVHKS